MLTIALRMEIIVKKKLRTYYLQLNLFETIMSVCYYPNIKYYGEKNDVKQRCQIDRIL